MGWGFVHYRHAQRLCWLGTQLPGGGDGGTAAVMPEKAAWAVGRALAADTAASAAS